MRGVTRSEPKSLSVFSSLNVRRSSVRTKIAGETYQSKCGAFVGQNQNSGQYFLAIFQSEQEFLAIFIDLNARRCSAGTEVPGNSYQFECEVFVSQNQNSWRYLPV